jgi:hypothetical protein
MAEIKYTKRPKERYVVEDNEESTKKASKTDLVNFCRVAPLRDSFNPEISDFTFMQIDVDCDTYTMDYGKKLINLF